MKIINKFPFLFLFLLVACGDEKLKKVEVLGEFRILGIIASSPEVAPGGSSTLRLIVSDINGGGRTISAQVESCVDPGISLGAQVSCDHDSSKVSNSYSIDTASDPDLGSGNLYTGQANATLNITVPGTILNGRTNREKFNGVGYINIFSITLDGRTVKAFKRIIATNRGTLNSNPTLSAITVNGGSISSRPGANDLLGISSSGSESYQFQNIDGTFENLTESFELAWYISSGEIVRSQVSASDTVRIKTASTATSQVIFAVIRDGRGGIAFRREVI